MKIFVDLPDNDTRKSFFRGDLAKRLEAVGEVIWNETGGFLSPEDAGKYAPDAEVIVTGWGSPRYDADALKHFPNVRLLAHTGGSIAGIADLSTFDAGVRVICGNELFAESVAEGVIAYALSALRNIPDMSAMTHDGKYVFARQLYSTEGLLDQTFGLIGFGAIAKNLVRLLKPFRCKIKVFADHVTPAEAASYGIEKAQSMEEVFTTCKIISIQLAKLPETYHIIDRKLMELLRPDQILINTSRGSIIDEDAMGELLLDCSFKAVLDVYEHEPLRPTSPLTRCPTAILLPHCGGPTHDRHPNITAALIEEIEKIRDGATDSWLEIHRDHVMRMTREKL